MKLQGLQSSLSSFEKDIAVHLKSVVIHALIVQRKFSQETLRLLAAKHWSITYTSLSVSFEWLSKHLAMDGSKDKIPFNGFTLVAICLDRSG